MKFLILSLLLLSSTGCTACTGQQHQAEPKVIVAPAVDESKPAETLYTCVYKYDSKYNIVFLEKNRVVYYPPTLPNLQMYRIVDTRGQKWAVNEYDWKNYRCTTSKFRG